MKEDKEFVKIVIFLLLIALLIFSISCYIDYEETKHVPKEFRQWRK